MKTARETALLILYKTEYEGAYPNIELKNAIPPQMPQNDRAFVTALVYGVISRKLTLDYIIERSSKIKLKKYQNIFIRFCVWVYIRYCLWIKFRQALR